MPLRNLPTREKFLSLRLQTPRKWKVLFVVVVLTFAACAVGGAGARVTAEEDARPCGSQPLDIRYTPGDYDGDGKADLAVFRPSDGFWYVLNSCDNQPHAIHWGIPGDKLVSADYDGDRKEDFAVYRKSVGIWWILYSKTGASDWIQFGAGVDEPAPADYDGDGKADLAVSRDGVYKIRKSADEEIVDRVVHVLSNHNDINVPGDYDGDRMADPAVFHDPNPENPSSDTHPGPRIWIIYFSGTQKTARVPFGEIDDVPVPGDYNGDGKTDIAVWRPGTGTWHIIANPTEVATSDAGEIVAPVAREVSWGLANDKVAPADYDGDGKTDVAVWRPSEGVWYIIKSWTNAPVYPHWGQATDIPVPMSLKRHEH